MASTANTASSALKVATKCSVTNVTGTMLDLCEFAGLLEVVGLLHIIIPYKVGGHLLQSFSHLCQGVVGQCDTSQLRCTQNQYTSVCVCVCVVWNGTACVCMHDLCSFMAMSMYSAQKNLRIIH